MSVAVRPDGSIVFRTRESFVFLDLPNRVIRVRDTSAGLEAGPSADRIAYPLVTVDRIRISQATEPAHLWLELAGGAAVDLGELASQELAMRIARAIALVTRCSIEFEMADSRPLGDLAAIAASMSDPTDAEDRAARTVGQAEYEDADPTVPAPVYEAELVDDDDIAAAEPETDPLSLEAIEVDDDDTLIEVWEESEEDATICRPATDEERALRDRRQWADAQAFEERTPKLALAPALPPEEMHAAARDLWSDIRITPRPGSLKRPAKLADSARYRVGWLARRRS